MEVKGVGGSSGSSYGTLAFPEQQAQIILEYARETGQHAAEKLIDEIRDWGGHPEIMSARTEHGALEQRFR